MANILADLFTEESPLPQTIADMELAMKTQSFSILVLFSIASCSGNGKGIEEDVPTDGKADSFRNPTVHGNIEWGKTHKPKFSEETGYFHAYDFEIRGEAEVTLESKRSSKTMDTVMYLYKYNDQSNSWGSYIAKNDDKSGRTQFSFLKEDLRSGRYRVLLKPYRKTSTKGNGIFKFLGDCDGLGCVSGPDLPQPSLSASSECVSAIASVLESNVIATESLSKTVAPGEDVANEYDLAVQLFFQTNQDSLEYILDSGGMADFNLRVRQAEFGKSVSLWTGYERETVYLFDTFGRLLMAQHTWEGEGDVAEYFCQTYDQGSDGDWFSDSECGVVVTERFPAETTLIDYGYVDSNGTPDPVSIAHDKFEESFPGYILEELEYNLYRRR